MDFPNDPILVEWRKDSNNNQYGKLIENEPHIVTNGFITLHEIPDYYDRVTIVNKPNMYEVEQNEPIIDANTYKVFYDSSKKVIVDPSLEGQTLNVTYRGQGIIMIPSSIIYDVQSGQIIDTVKSLDDFINSIKIVGWQGEYDNKTLYFPNAIVYYPQEKTIYRCLVLTKGNLPTNTTYWQPMISVKEASDYATAQGDYAKEQGTYAKNQGDYAKSEGDYAKAQGDLANDVSDKLSVWETYNPSKQYVFLNKVIWQSSSYICIADSKGIAPDTDPTKWLMIVKKGNDGIASFDEVTVPITANGTSHIVHNLSFDPVHDVLKIIECEFGTELVKGDNYSENADHKSIDLIGWTVDIGQKFLFKLYKGMNDDTLQQVVDDSIVKKNDLSNVINDSVQKKNDLANVIATADLTTYTSKAESGLIANLKTNDKTSIVNAINENVASLNDIAINVKSFGAKGDGITDDTTSITNAINYCTSNNKILYFPNGTYNDSLNRVIACNIKGENQYSTKWVYTGSSGIFITVSSFYDKHATINNITLQLKDTSKIVSGLKVMYSDVNGSAWGGSLKADNISIDGFTDKVLHLSDTFNCQFSKVSLKGDKLKSKLLVIEAVNSFPNCNTFIGCNFFNGKIGIQLLGCADVKFTSCVYENITLLLNVVKLNIQPDALFERCWFEGLNSPSIINAKIDESTLLTIIPTTNFSSLSTLHFNNNWSANVATPILSSTINSNYEGVTSNYSLINGATPISPIGYLSKTITYNSGNNVNATPSVLNEISTSFDLSSILNSVEAGTYTLTNPTQILIGVCVQMLGGNTVYANFITTVYSKYEKVPFTQIGTTYDPNNLGNDYKIKIERDATSNNYIFKISAKGYNASIISYTITLLRPNV